MTDHGIAKWSESFPNIDWVTPVPVQVAGQATFYCCRVCIAEKGLRGAAVADVPFCFSTPDLSARHIQEAHGE